MKHLHQSKSLFSVFVAILLACSATPAVSAPALTEDIAEASMLLEKENFAAAHGVLAKYLAEEKNKKDASAWQANGLACFGLRWFEDSADSFAMADELEPDNGLTLFYRGVLVLIDSHARDKEARAFFDRSASLESSMKPMANLMKYSMMKYINIKGRSVSKEFDAWRKALPEDNWEAQLANYLRRPVNHEALKAQCESHKNSRDSRDLDLMRHLFIGLKCETNLYGTAADNVKKAMMIERPGSPIWELARVWYGRLGNSYNWVTTLSYMYGPNEMGELEVVIKDRESFALARGLRNGDIILELNDQPADLNLLEASFNEMKVGDDYRLKIRREEQEREFVLVMDTPDFRMRPTPPR